MRKYLVLITTLLLLLSFPTLAQTQTQSQGRVVDYLWVPRVSAYEAEELWSKAQEGLKTLQGLISYIEKSGV